MAACRVVAKEHTVPLVDHYKHWTDAEAKGTVLREWTTDGCHPNPRGHKELADLIAPSEIDIVFQVPRVADGPSYIHEVGQRLGDGFRGAISDDDAQ